MYFKKSSEAGQATGSDALLDRAIPREPPSGLSCDPDDALVRVLPNPKGSAHGLAPADARAGAGARPIRLPAATRADATRRLARRQRALLSGVHGGESGLASQAAVAACDGRPSGAATASGGAQ